MKRSNFLLSAFSVFLLSFSLYSNDFEKTERIIETQDLQNRIVDMVVNPDKSITRNYGEVTVFSNIPGDILLRNEKRSIRLLTQEQIDDYKITLEKINKIFKTKATSLNQFYIFANFINGYNKTEMVGDYEKKDAQFWIAIISKGSKVKNVIMQEEQFHKGVGSHFQIRFILDEAILLIPQDQTDNANWVSQVADLTKLDITDKKILEIRKPFLMSGDLVYSLNAVRTENGPKSWGIVEGGLGSFANSLGVYSTTHVSYNQTQDNVVRQYEIKVDQPISQKIFAYAIKRSGQVMEKSIYHTIHNACHTTALEALHADGQGLNFNPYEDFNPYRIILGLQKKGFITKELDTINKIFKAQVQNLDNVQAYQLAQQNMWVLTSDIFDKLILDIGNFILREKVTKEELAALKLILSDPGSMPQTAEEMVEFSTANNVDPQRIGYFLETIAKEKKVIQTLIKERLGVEVDLDKVWQALLKILSGV